VAEAGTQRIGDLHAQHVAEYRGKGLLPVRIEAFRHPLQAAREIGVAFDAQLAHGRGVVVAKEGKLRDQSAQRAAHGEVGFGGVRDRPYLQAVTGDRHLQRQLRRGHVQRNAAAVERPQAIAGLGIQCQRAIERGLQRAAGEGL
jgi:hypothetical protein